MISQDSSNGFLQNLSIKKGFVLFAVILYVGMAASVAFQYAQLAQISGEMAKSIANNFLIAMTLLAVISMAVMIWTFYRVLKPLSHIEKIAGRIAEGDYTARCDFDSNHEIGRVGKVFDDLLSVHISKQTEIEMDNEQLNASIIELLQAVYQLSQKDLTVEVPVSTDLTGSISDALNLLISETAGVLQGVSTISERVNNATTKVKAQSSAVQSLADVGKREIYQSLTELKQAAQVMNNISELAKGVNGESSKAIETTETALATVNESVESINKIRETIHHAEKGLKRLGERSQDITGMVKLVNDIAERTNILALNAGMHATSAGEAGRGFMVIADEVQRLAESSREATAQISELVQNIQIETSDTVETMNKVITRVVEGSRLAEQAGMRMKETRQTTLTLVESVQQITKNSDQQAHVSRALLQRAQKIHDSTEKTNEKLKEQAVFTSNLAEYAQELIAAVRVFKLPA